MVAVPDRPPLAQGTFSTRATKWARENLFSSWLNSAATLLIAYLVLKVAFAFLSWAFFNAVWSVPNQDTQVCRDLKGIGACWALITEKYRFIMFGTYPYEEQWRELVAIILFLALYGVSAMRRFWTVRLIYAWVV